MCCGLLAASIYQCFGLTTSEEDHWLHPDDEYRSHMCELLRRFCPKGDFEPDIHPSKEGSDTMAPDDPEKNISGLGIMISK